MMVKPNARGLLLAGCALFAAHQAFAQFGRGTDWVTGGYDAQRSFWMRGDAKINPQSVSKGFAFLWKMKLNNTAKGLNSLTTPTLMDRLIGWKGFRALAFLSGANDKVYVVDSDLARHEWSLQLPAASSSNASVTCPGGLTSPVIRPTMASFPPPPGPVQAGLGGRGGPAKSGVGEPNEGAVTLKALGAPRPSAPAAPANAPNQRARRTPAAASATPAFGAPSTIFTISSSGSLHTLNTQNGADALPPMKFLPPSANAGGLTLLDHFAYASTDGGCAGVPDGVWALDLNSKQVVSWKSPGGVAGNSFAFGPDSTIYVATRTGQLVALDGDSLKQKAAYATGGQPFTSSPVVIEFKGRTLIAAATKDGRLHLLDAANLSSALDKSPVFSAPGFDTGALASFQERNGTRWILAPAGGNAAASAGLSANGSVTNGAIVAFQVVEKNGAPALAPGWASRDLKSPVTPMIMNGVVFALASGEFRPSDPKTPAAQIAQRSTPAVLYALDGSSGKELWSSGSSITSFVHGQGMAGSAGQLYLVTYDGTLYAFGFPMEH